MSHHIEIDKLYTFVKSIEGYKISNTHFKIGTKWHSRHFFYAKRLFQNSYYTSRLAMLIAIKIIRMHAGINNLTIVGYEIYSELIISMIKKYLISMGVSDINTCVIIDNGTSMQEFPLTESIKENHMIIVPIASTGSTAGKIESYIKDKYNNRSKLLHVFNIIEASDITIDEIENHGSVTNISNILHLDTTWFNPLDCELCYSDDKSIPLLVTDKSSLIPTLIYDLPESKKMQTIDKAKPTPLTGGEQVQDSRFEWEQGIIGMPFHPDLFSGSLRYISNVQKKHYYLFANDIDIFIKINEKKIREWLFQVKQYLNIESTQKTILLSPCSDTNTGFVDMVNECIFGLSATIIHYQLSSDYIENFRSLNKHYFHSDARVYYVDDELISGKTFFEIYDLFRYTVKYSSSHNYAGAFILLNKASADLNMRVCRAAKHAHFFTAINLPSSFQMYDNNPLSHEIVRYKRLADIAIHDIVKIHYIERSKRLEIFQSNKEENERHYRMFEATHRIYEGLTHIANNNIEIERLEFKDFIKSCGFKEIIPETELAVMKVLCQYPFTLYRRLLEQTFKWHKEQLNNIISVIDASISQKKFTYVQFQELKFHIRRAVFLGNQRIICVDFFRLLSRVFDIIDICNIDNQVKTITQKMQYASSTVLDLFNQNSSERTQLESSLQHWKLFQQHKKEILEFHLFLVYQYLEVVEKNRWGVNHIVSSLNNTEFNTLDGKRFKRILWNELSFVLSDLYKSISKEKKWYNLYKSTVPFGNPSHITNIQTIEIEKFINDIYYKIRQKVKIVNDVIKIYDDGCYSPLFIKYLWIKQYIHNDCRGLIAQDSLQYKTEQICKRITSLFGDDLPINTFFIVVDGLKHNNIVYGYNTLVGSYIQTMLESQDVNDDKNYNNEILRFLYGDKACQPSIRTIVEYTYNKEEEIWENVYNPSEKIKELIPGTNCEWCMLIRIGGEFQINSTSTSYMIENRDPLGVIGFYGARQLTDNYTSKLYVLSLREELKQFIQYHYQNDEFMHLRIAETTRRFAYLAGHGRQILQELAQDKAECRDIIATMESLQYLFATRLIPEIGQLSQIKKGMNEELMKSFTPSNIEISKFHQKIKDLIKIIYESNIVENTVPVSILPPSIDPEELKPFLFNESILSAICMELIINAKKNRFHYLRNVDFESGSKNKIKIQYRYQDDACKILEIDIQSTGCEITQTVCNAINEGRLKSQEEISGIELIRKILCTLNPKNNISIDSSQSENICVYINEKEEELTIYNNTVKLIIFSNDAN